MDNFQDEKFETETLWRKTIDLLRQQTIPSTKFKLKNAITSSIIQQIPKKRFGIFFSGGIDSSLIALICKQNNADFICYTVGIKDSPDIRWAKKVAKELNLNLKTKEFTLNELEKLFKRTAQILKTNNSRVDTLTMGVGSVFVACLDLSQELNKKDKLTDFFSGTGSEELFAGYERHVNAEDIHEECWGGLASMFWRDLTRDFAISNFFKSNLLLPFLSNYVIKEAMGIHTDKKVNKEFKKVILREIAQELGLPKEFAWRKKQAAQYGSKFDNAILKIAKKNGFDKKLDWLKSL